MTVVGSAEVEILPTTTTFAADLKSQISKGTGLEAAGEEAGRQIDKGVTKTADGSTAATKYSTSFKDSTSFAAAGEQAGRKIEDGITSEVGGKDLEGRFTSIGSNLGRQLLTGFAVVEVGRAINSALQAAGDVSQQVSANEAIFGTFAKQVTDFSKSAATAFGVSEQAALKYTNTFGNLLVEQGVGAKQAATLSDSLVGLAANLASFRNTPIDDVLTALQSGLTGNARALKPFGIELTDATLKAEALREGLIKASVAPDVLAKAQGRVTVATNNLATASAKYGAQSKQAIAAQVSLNNATDALNKTLAGKTPTALTNAQKAVAAYGLIVQQSQLATDNFSKSLATSLPDQLKLLSAEFANLKVTAGQALAPAALEFVKAITNSVLPAVTQLANALTPALAPLGELVTPLAGAIASTVTALLPAVTKLVPAFSAVVTAIAPILPLLATVVSDLSGPVAAAISGLATAVTPLVTAFVKAADQILTAFQPILTVLDRVFATLGSTIGGAFTQLSPVIARVATQIAGFLTTLTPVFSALSTTFVGVITSTLTELLPVVREIGTVIGSVFTQLAPILATLGRELAPVIVQLGSTIGALVTGALSTFVSLLRVLAPLVEHVVSLFGGTFVQVLGVLARVFAVLEPAVLGVADALATGIAQILPVVVGLLTQLAPIVTTVANILGGVLLQVLPVLATSLEAIVPPIVALVSQLAGPLQVAFAAVAPIVGQLATILATTLVAVLPVVSGLIVKLAPLVGQLIPPFTELITVLAGSASKNLTLFATIITNLIPAVAQLVPQFLALAQILIKQLLPVLPALAKLLVSLTTSTLQLLAAFSPFLPTLVKIALVLVDVGLAATGVLAVIELLVAIAPALSKVITGLSIAISAIGDGFANAGAQASGLARTIATSLGDAFKFLFSVGVTFLNFGLSLGNSLVKGFQTGVDAIFQILNNVATAITKFVEGLLASIQSVFRTITNGISSLNPVSAVTGAVRAIGGSNGVAGAVTGAISAVTGSTRPQNVQTAQPSGSQIVINESASPRQTAREVILAQRSQAYLFGRI